MRVTIWYENGSVLILNFVRSIEMKGFGELEIATFGNLPNRHRYVLSVSINDLDK